VLGLSSLVSYLVAERTHEIGLRMALGANAADVRRLVLGHALKIAITGLSVGIPTALLFTRLLGSLLYGVTATDPLIFVGAACAVLGISAGACDIPARRAMRLDPLAALRS
jgi:ABC-type antimicrobial peptide transport system permease subunit